MRTLTLPLLLLATISLLSSCGSSRNFHRTVAPIERSVKLKLDKRDNLRLYEEVAAWLGTPHCDGGTTPRCTDCSNLVRTIYRSVYGLTLSRSSAQMLENDCRKRNKNNLNEGDLLFFNTQRTSSQKPSHVGIYLKDGHFVHTSTRRGVIISHLDEPYYLDTWLTGGKVKQ